MGVRHRTKLKCSAPPPPRITASPFFSGRLVCAVQVCYACVRAEEFRLASVCGLHILKHPDHVEELIQHYERAGHPTELIQLMEQGLGLEEAHSGVFTELAVLYTKYSPEKLMEHIKIFWSRCNVTKVGDGGLLFVKSGLHEELHGGESIGMAGRGGLWMERQRSKSLKSVCRLAVLLFFCLFVVVQ